MTIKTSNACKPPIANFNTMVNVNIRYYIGARYAVAKMHNTMTYELKPLLNIGITFKICSLNFKFKVQSIIRLNCRFQNRLVRSTESYIFLSQNLTYVYVQV